MRAEKVMLLLEMAGSVHRSRNQSTRIQAVVFKQAIRGDKWRARAVSPHGSHASSPAA